MKLKILLILCLLFSCERVADDDNIKFSPDVDAIKVNVSQHHLNTMTIVILERIYYNGIGISKIEKSYDTIPMLGMVQDTVYKEETDNDTIIKSNKNYKFFISVE